MLVFCVSRTCVCMRVYVIMCVSVMIHASNRGWGSFLRPLPSTVHHMDYYGLDPEIFLKNPGAANDDALHAKDIKPADQPKDIKLADQLASNPALFPATSTSTGILHSPSSSALDSIVRKPGATATASLCISHSHASSLCAPPHLPCSLGTQVLVCLPPCCCF